MPHARCACGALTLELRGPPKLVAACHCRDCQRRTGSPFGTGAFYPGEAVTVSGTAKEFVRDGSSGGKVRFYFCPDCGSSLYWKPDVLASLIGVAVGAIADPDFPAPTLSLFEQSKHHWVRIDTAAQHFAQGTPRRNPLEAPPP